MNICGWSVVAWGGKPRRLACLLGDDILDTNEPRILLVGIVDDTLIQVLRHVRAEVVCANISGMVLAGTQTSAETSGVEGEVRYARIAMECTQMLVDVVDRLEAHDGLVCNTVCCLPCFGFHGHGNARDFGGSVG